MFCLWLLPQSACKPKTRRRTKKSQVLPNPLVVVMHWNFSATTNVKNKKEQLNPLLERFFGVVFAFVDAQLPLGFDTAAFTRVSSAQNRWKLKEGAFGTECTHFLFLLPCHHPFEHWQCNGYHDDTEHDEDYEFISYLRYACAQHHNFS